ncbi:MAG TPA: methyltransferase domain-containing protein [Pseudoxanthomonas sp.]
MNMQVSTIVKGALTFIPGITKALPGIGIGTGGTNSASYCYGVWLKHLVLLHESGLRQVPDTVAELGPGDSCGIGLAAMLTGVNHYYALDVVRHGDNEDDVAIFDELLRLFQTRAARPTKGWPDYDGFLDEGLFPSHILTDELLAASLAPDRVARIRSALTSPAGAQQDLSIRYMVPWFDDNVIDEGSVDLIISHSVLEHVVDLDVTYQAMRAWLKPEGWMSHQIDFKCHGLSGEWNGYRQYPEVLWKLVVGTRPFLLNRQPYSVHSALLERHGFEVVLDLKQHITDRGIKRSQLSSHWQGISDDDLTCAGAFIQAGKKTATPG